MKDRAHYLRWSASQPCLRPVPQSRLCGYLWRRKWLGQWTKQLFIVRDDVLLVRSQHERLPSVVPVSLTSAPPPVLQVRPGPAAPAGAEPARLSARLQVQEQREDPAPAQAGSAGLRDAGAGIQQLPTGRRVEEGERQQVGVAAPSRGVAHAVGVCR